MTARGGRAESSYVGGYFNDFPDRSVHHTAGTRFAFDRYNERDVRTRETGRGHEDRFARPVELSREAGDILTTPLLPGLTIPLERIFRE